MKKKIIVITGVVLLFGGGLYYFFSPSSLFLRDQEKSYFRLPKVAFLTSGINKGNGILPAGAVVALQVFNKQGIHTSMVSRDILLNSAQMKEFSILILSTAIDYYDVDRKYSLTFMSDEELTNLKEWIRNGGVLIAGDNIGRNTLDASDRSNLLGKLTPENWILGECFGVSLHEKDLTGFHIKGSISDSLQGFLVEASMAEQWALVVDSIYSKKVKSLAVWTNGRIQYPAFIENNFGKGISFLLPSSYLLHPANSGGKWSIKQIAAFYEYVAKEFYAEYKNKVWLNPWPQAFDNAFCVTLNAAGNQKEYEHLFSYLKAENITPSVFVDGSINEEFKIFLSAQKLNVESNGFKKLNFRDNSFADTKIDILSNENYWGKDFQGFRFPYTKNSNWGIMVLNDLKYKFDSSIGADNIDDFYGSVVPYYLPLSFGQYYKISDVLEISPPFHDDFYFYQNLPEVDSTNKEQQEKQAKLFEKYLLNFWNYGVKPFDGAMVFMGHPAYTGNNETTMLPLKTLIQKIKKDNTWITTIEEIAIFRDKISKLHFDIEGNENQMNIVVRTVNDIKADGVSLRFNTKPARIKIENSDYQLIEINNLFYLIFNAYNGQKIELHF